METISNAMLSSWELNPSVLIPTAIFSALYARGWWQLHRRASNLFGFSQLAAFFAGLSTIVFALISPLHAFAAWLLTVHMIQHLLLMMVAPAAHPLAPSFPPPPLLASAAILDLCGQAISFVHCAPQDSPICIAPGLL